MYNFLKFYLKYVLTRDSGVYAPFGHGPVGYYLYLFGHIALSVVFFEVRQAFGVWSWLGWVFLAYAIIQAYAWIIDDPVREYRQPIDDFERKIIGKQGKALRNAAAEFCSDVARGGGRPTRAAERLLDAVGIYYALLRTRYSLTTFQVMVDEYLNTASQNAGVVKPIFVVYGKEGFIVPSRFGIQTNLKNGERFNFERPLI